MSQYKIAKSVLLILTGMMVAALAAYYVLTSLGFSVARLADIPLPPVASDVVTGTVLFIENKDGATTFIIKTNNGTSTVFVRPSIDNGESCRAGENIADVTAFSVGDTLSARGFNKDGTIYPCQNGSDYLKVIKDDSLDGTIATTSGNIYSNGVERKPQTNPTVPEVLISTTFTGTLEKVDTGCFADGECFVVVDGKYVTTLRGWAQGDVGSILGVEGFGDLERYIGKQVEVRAAILPDNTYTLYGDPLYYVKLLP
jgi:hypothetical protein